MPCPDMKISTYSLPAAWLAHVTGVHLETAKRWKRAGAIPKHYAHLVALRTEGNLGVIAGDWDGWRLRDQQLWTPDDVVVTPGEIRAIPYQKELLRELKKQLAEPQQWSLI